MVRYNRLHNRPGNPRSSADAPRTRLSPLSAGIRAAFLPALALSLHSGITMAGPEGGKVVGGQGNINKPDANTTVINQQSQNLAVDWTSFNVKQKELVQFKQPAKTANALNRIYDQNPSQIYGTIRANGNVTLLNPNGVFFSPTSRVNVNNLKAGTLVPDPTRNYGENFNMDFFDGPQTYKNVDGSEGIVVNQGLLEAATGGSVSLVGKAVRNEGVILAYAGQVNLVAGEQVTMDFDGDGLIRFTVDKEVLANTRSLDSQVSNTGEINADGGAVLLAGSAASEVFSRVVNNEGVISARRIENKGGTVRLVGGGSGSSVLNMGTVNASAGDATSDGGSIDIAADNIENSGKLNANSTGGDGGTIKLESKDTTLVTGNAVISASSIPSPSTGEGQTTSIPSPLEGEGQDGGKGGSVKILGDKVGLMDNSSVKVSGTTGGGEALIGGDFQGKNPDVKNASRTYVAEDASIEADAIKDGDGGRVIVWADEVTGFYGFASARGGDQSGDGGFIEISGKQLLAFDGTVDLGAPGGSEGTVLFDPDNILVSGDDTDGASGGDILFADTPAADPWNVSDTALEAITGNIILQANDTITVDNELNLTNQTGGEEVVFQAGGDITLNESIITNGADIHLEANSPSATDGDPNLGMLTIAATKSVDTTNGGGNGNVILIAEDFTLDGNVTAGSGNISLTAIGNSNGSGTGEAAFEIGSAADLTDGELGRFSTTGTVTIGEATTASGAGVIGGGTTIRVGAIEFQAASNVSTAGGVAGSLVFTADDGITFNDDAAFGQTVTFNADGDADNAGAITRGAAEVITGSTVNLNAATGITIDTAATTISAVNTTSGNIDINNAATAATTLSNFDHQGAGNILFDQTGNQTLALTSVTANDGDITITNTGGTDSDITVKTVTADTTDDTVSITAEDGIFDDAADAATDIITAANISLTSSANATGIGDGAEGAIEVNATVSFAADSSTGGGNITVEDTTGDFPLGLVDAGTGNVNLTSAGSITDANAGANNIAAGTADLTATGAVGDLAGAGNGDVTMAPTDALETTVDTLSIDAVEAAIANTIAGGLTVTSVTPAGVAGSVLITNNMDLVITAHTLSNDGDSIGYVSTTGSVTVPDAAIDVGGGTIRIEAATDGQDVLDATDGVLNNNLWTANTVVFASGFDEALDLDVTNLTANITDTTGGGAGGLTITEADGITLTNIDTADGMITVTAALGNITVLDVDAGGTNTVTLDSTAGNINDGGAVSEVITADSLRLSAETGILALDTAVSNLAAETDTTGNLEVFNTGALDITTVDGVVGVQIVDAGTNDGGGDIVITASSPLTISDDVINNDGGDITLAADGNAAGDNLAINANVTATGGNGAINLFAGDAININGTNIVSAAGTGNITAIAGEDFVSGGANNNGTATGIFTMADGTTIETEDGNIIVRATGSVDLSLLDADSNGDGTAPGTGDVTVEADFAGIDGGLSTADTGDIQDILTGETANIIGDTINLIGEDGIGDGDDIDVTVITALNADSSGNNGNIELESTGDMPIGVINAGNGNITLVSTGAMTDTNGGTLNITGNLLDMTANGGAIGTIGDKIDTNVTQIVADTTAVDGSGVFINELDGAADGLAIGAADILTDGGDVEIMSAGDVTSASGADIETSGEVNTAQDSGIVTIATSGTAIIDLAGNITTTGADNNAGNASAGGDVMLTTNNGTIDVALITTSGGDATTSGDNGGNAGLISLDTGSGNTINLDGATITANGGGTVDANEGNGNNITFADPVMLNTGVTVSATGNSGGDIEFTDSVDGVQTLVVNTSGNTTFGGAVGNGAALTSVTTDAGGTTHIDGGEVTTTGTQTYNDTVELGATTNLNTTGNTITFNGALIGTTNYGEDLNITAGTGNVLFNNLVGITAASAGAAAAGDTAVGLGDITVVSATNLNVDADPADAGLFTIGVNEANSDNTFYADSLTATVAGDIDIGDIGAGDSGDVFIRGNAGGDTLALTSNETTNGDSIVINSNILVDNGNVVFTATDNSQDIRFDIDGLAGSGTGAGGNADITTRSIVATTGDITTVVAQGNARTFFHDFDGSGMPTASTDGINFFVQGDTVSIDGLDVATNGANLDDDVYPHIIATTISVSFDGSLELGDEAIGAIPAPNSLDDTQMDGLLAGGATALVITVNATGATEDTAGNIVLDRATSFGSNDLDLTAAGYISDNSNGLAYESTGLLTLESGAGIGIDNPGTGLGNTGGSLTIDVNNLITITDAVGAVNITNNASGGDATYVADSAGTGSITDLTITQDANNLLINEINASGAVGISSAGAIVDNDDTDIDITGTTIHLVASTGIADGDELSINATDAANGLAATTTTGDINILDTTGGLSIGSITTDFDDTGAATIMTDGASITGGAAGDDVRIRATSPVTVNNDVSNTGGGNILLAAEGSALTDELEINANITASGGNGTIQLFAGGLIDHNSGIVSAAGATGTIDIFGGRDFADGTPAAGHADGGIDMEAGAAVQQGNGATVTLAGRGDVDVAAVTSTGGTVNVTAGDDTFAADTDGAITDDNAGATNITATSTTLTADTGIDTDTDVTNLTADNITANNIDIDEVDDVTLATTFRNQAAGGSLSLATTDGSIDTSTVAVLSNDGDINLTAADAGANNDRSITVGSGGISSDTGAGNINLLAADGVSLAANVDAGTGNVTIDADSDAAEAGNLDLTGAITQTGGTVSGTTIDLDAEEGIDLDTAGSSISADNTTSGNVDIDNTLAGAVTVTSLTNVNGGNILFDNTGAGGVTFETVTAGEDGSPADGEADVTLTSSGGGDLSISGGTATVAAGATEGDVNITTNDDGSFDMGTGTGAITAGQDVLINSDNSATLHNITSSTLTVNVDVGGGNTSLLDLGTGTLSINGGATTIDATGNGADDTLRGQDVANTWVITGANQGVLNPVGTDFATFTDIGTISGGDDVQTDTIDQRNTDIDAGAAVTGDVDVALTGDGLTDGDGLAGDLDIGGALQISFDNMDVIISPDGNINDTFTGYDQNAGQAIWTIDGGTTELYAADGNDIEFSVNLDSSSSFRTLTGNADIDVFNLNASYIGDLEGAGGDDTFDIADLVTLSGTIDGGPGIDVLDIQDVSNPTVTIAGAGSQDGSRGDLDAPTDPIDKGAAADDFDNINTLLGDAGAPAGLVGPDADTVWNITGTDSGTYGNDGDETAFTNFNITGGNQRDTFFFDGGTIGSIDGGALGEGNTLIGDNAINNMFTIDGDGSGNEATLFDGSVFGFDDIDNVFGGTNDDTFTISDNVTFSGILAGNGGNDTLTVNYTDSTTWTIDGAGVRPEVYDSNDTAPNNTVIVGTIDAGDAAVDGSSGTANGDGTLSFIEFETINAVNGAAAVVDTFDIEAVDNDLTINARGGDDVFNVTNATNSLDDIVAVLTLRGDADSDTLNVDDSGDADADNGAIDATDITGIFGAGGSIDYSDGAANFVENITITLGSGDDTFNVASLNPDAGSGSDVTINGSDGDDTVDLGASSLDGILGTLTVNGNGHTAGDTLNVNDDTDNDGNTYTITDTMIARTGIPTITYGTFEQLDVNTGGGNDTLNVSGWASTTGNIIDAGGATDSYTTTGSFSVTGDFTITDIETIADVGTAELGADTLTINNANAAIGVSNFSNPFDVNIGSSIDINNTGGNDVTIDNDSSTDTSIEADLGGDADFLYRQLNPGNVDISAGGLDAGATSGSILILTRDDLTQTGDITALDMIIFTGFGGDGDVDLSNAGNDITNLAADTTGSFSYRDTNSFTVTTVTTPALMRSGIVTDGENVTLQSSGNLVINQQISASGGDVTLNSGAGTITDGASGVISANVLSTTNTNSVTLDTQHSVSTFNATANGTVRFDNGIGLSLNNVDTSGNQLTINNDANLAVTGTVDSGGGDTTINTTSGGNINNGGGTITSNNLNLNAGGGIGTTGALDTTTAGNFTLVTGGNGAAGNASINETNSFNTSVLDLTSAASSQVFTFTSGGTITINDADAGTSNLDANDTLILNNTAAVLNNITTANVSLELNSATNAFAPAGSLTLDTGTGDLTLGGDYNGGGGEDLTVVADNFTINGDISGQNMDFSGANRLTPGVDTLMTSSNNTITFPGSVSGNGTLAIDPTDTTAMVLGGTNGNAGEIPSAPFSGFSGHLVIGGTYTPLASPFEDATTIDISALSIDVDSAFSTNGAITLLAGDLNLNDDISAGGPGGDTLSLVAAGNDPTVASGGGGDINVSGGGVTIAGGNAFIVAGNTINDPNDITVDLNNGNIDVAEGSGDGNVEFAGGSDFSTTTGGTAEFNNLLGLFGFNATVSNITIQQAAADLLGIEELGFIDTGLFEEDLTLFGQIGTGIALALAQCEEVEGCAPNVSQEELAELIAQLEARIAELETRCEGGDAQACALLEGYQQELEQFLAYQVELEEFFAVDEEEEFEDEFVDEFEAPDTAGEINTLARILETVQARIEFLESLKTDPGERARLSEITGIELTQEALDAIIEGAKSEAQFIEEQIKLLQEGTEARAAEIFTAEAGTFDRIRTITYGPSILNLQSDTSLYPEEWFF